MDGLSYHEQRGRIETYFDRTAAAAWARLTSDAPLGRIRASVRAGRERMRDTLLSWLPADLHGMRLLDAGCGTGAFAVAAAERGATVVAVDLSPTLVSLAESRLPPALSSRVSFRAGDMLDPALGRFDAVVLMDSLIHYEPQLVLRALDKLAARTSQALLFTYAPRTPLLAAMHAAGRLLPAGNRAPAIVPIAPATLVTALRDEPALRDWPLAQTQRIASGFYTSQAVQLSHRHGPGGGR